MEGHGEAWQQRLQRGQLGLASKVLMEAVTTEHCNRSLVMTVMMEDHAS